MKIITTDNFGRDYQPEHVVAEKITNPLFAEIMVKALQEKFCDKMSHIWFTIVDDRYQCEVGIEDDWEPEDGYSFSHWGMYTIQRELT